jgi:hypothetical protein
LIRSAPCGFFANPIPNVGRRANVEAVTNWLGPIYFRTDKLIAAIPGTGRMAGLTFGQPIKGGLRKAFSPITAYLSSLCVVAALAGPCVAQSVPDPDCLKSSLADYWKANSTILEHLTPGNPFLSLEDQIGLRRFRELYCIRYTQCLYGANPDSTHVLGQRLTFSTCLRDQKLDPQIALPNN